MASTLFDKEELVCITGPPVSGKSSLLFQHAVSCAGSGCSVFLSPRPLDRLPLLEKSEHNPLSQQVLSRVLFKYPTSLSALQELFDRVHLPDGLVSHCPDKVNCILIDDFHEYFNHMTKSSGHEVTSVLARTCAHIADGLSYLSRLGGDSDPNQQPTCILSLTAQPHINTDVIKRWFPCVLRISEKGPNHYAVEKHGQLVFSYNIQESCFAVISGELKCN